MMDNLLFKIVCSLFVLFVLCNIGVAGIIPYSEPVYNGVENDDITDTVRSFALDFGVEPLLTSQYIIDIRGKNVQTGYWSDGINVINGVGSFDRQHTATYLLFGGGSDFKWATYTISADHNWDDQVDDVLSIQLLSHTPSSDSRCIFMFDVVRVSLDYNADGIADYLQIPEPTSLALLGIGSLLLRRKK
jgi:hypothetical protein